MSEVPPAPTAPAESWKPWAALTAVVAIAFVILLGPVINSRHHENDSWWMLPSVDYYTQDRSVIGMAGFIADTEPQMLGGPYVKLYFTAVLRGAGSNAGLFLWILVVLHAANSSLVFALGRRFGWGLGASAVSALLYFAAYGHFESYLWPCNIQHLLVTTFTLLVFTLYLRAEQRLSAREPHRHAWVAALVANAFATFNRMSIVVLPAVILVHLLAAGTSADDRVARFRRWLPLFAMYAFFPLLGLARHGDDQTGVRLAIPGTPWVLSWFLAAIVAIGVLLAVPWILRVAHRDARRTGWACAAIIVLVVLAAMAKDRRNLLLPIHAVLPAQTFLMSLAMPFGAVLGIDAAEAMYPVPSQTGVVPLAAAIGLGAAFVASVRDRRVLLPLLAWYLVPLPYLNLYDPVPSRYLTFVAVPVCLCVGWLLWRLYERAASAIPNPFRWRDAAACGALLALIGSNLLALKLELFRGRLANSFYVYDDIRTTALARTSGSPAVPGVRMPYAERWAFTPVDGDRFDNLRYVLRQEGVAAAIEPSAAAPPDPFLEDVRQGLAMLERGDAAGAESRFTAAAARRPHLVNYLLERHSLEDSVFITDRTGLRSFANRCASWWSSRDPKAMHVQAVMNRELDEYVTALFAIAYLRWKVGDEEGSAQWLYRIPYVDKDHLAVAALIGSRRVLAAQPGMAEFLDLFRNPEFYYDMPLWHPRLRNRFPSSLQVFLLKLATDGRFNRAVEAQVERSRKKKERSPASRYPVMPK